VTLPNRLPQPDGPLRLPALLSGHHTPTAAQWRALPNGSDAALIVIVEDPKESASVRVRAIEGLSARGAAMALGVLTAQVKGGDTEAIVRRAAIRGLPAFYATAGPEVESTLSTALDSPDPLTREAVVRALAPLMGKGGVRALLERHRADESHALVKEALSVALKGTTAQ